MKKQREIVIEVERERIICRRTQRYFAWCDECRAEVEFVTEPEATALNNLKSQTISGENKSFAIHTKIIADDVKLICLNSVF